MKHIFHHHIHAVSSNYKEQVIFIDDVKNQENEQTDLQLFSNGFKEKRDAHFELLKLDGSLAPKRHPAFN